MDIYRGFNGWRMHWKTIQRRKGSRGKRSRSSEDDLARAASSSEASEHFTPVKPRKRACEVEAFPLSLSPSSSHSLVRNLPFYLSFFRFFLSFSLFLSLHAFRLTHGFSLRLARARLFSSARFCAAKIRGDFDRLPDFFRKRKDEWKSAR